MPENYILFYVVHFHVLNQALRNDLTENIVSQINAVLWQYKMFESFNCIVLDQYLSTYLPNHRLSTFDKSMIAGLTMHANVDKSSYCGVKVVLLYFMAIK